MIMRLIPTLCGFSMILIFASHSGADTTEVSDLTKKSEERAKARLRQVEQQFVTDSDKLLQKYKKDFDGGNYNLTLVKELANESRIRAFKPTPGMLKCSEQYMIDLYTKKHEKEHILFYCMDTDKPVKSDTYTKTGKRWKLDGK